MHEALLFLHPTFGVLGLLAALWVFVETINASDANAARIRTASYTCAGLMILTFLVAGDFYTRFYGVDKATILGGPQPWAHSFFMETKEHVFFITFILALLLPFVARTDLVRSANAKLLTLTVSGLVVLSALAIEGAGATISFGVKAALTQAVGS